MKPEFDLKRIGKYLETIWWKEKRPKFDYWNEVFTQPVTRKYKVSICTTAMDRKHMIEKTYLKNIKDNLAYPNVEFVLLDYNSKDGLDEWVKENLMEYINKGIVNYYRTEEPTKYSMTHSRNIAFKVAEGDIVNNVDADNYTCNDNEPWQKPACFAETINKMANQYHRNIVFAKSKQKLRGRLGFFKEEFINILNGYDEDLTGYGHDDNDLLFRALELGFTMMCFRGSYFSYVEGHKKHEDNSHYTEPWWYTEGKNQIMSFCNLLTRKFKANEGKHWGKATLIKNFKEKVEV